MMKKVSVVILNWNGMEMLRNFLPSVVEYSKKEGVEVCVADNASTDSSVEMLRNDFSEVRLILLDKNYGFAEGYNRALEYIDSEYVVLLNSDVEVTPNWLLPLIDYMDAHPETAACQPKLRSQRSKRFFEYAGASGGYLDRYGYPFCRGRVFDVVEEDKGQYDTIADVFWTTGAAMFVRLKDYREAGGLDANFFAHMEEVDLCWRLKNRGRNLVCIPQSVVYHVGGATLNKENPRKTFLNFRNNLLMLYKNLPDAELKQVLRVRACLDVLAALAFLLKGEWRNAKTVFVARREYKKMLPLYAALRNDVQQNIMDGHLMKGRMSYSILWKFHIMRKRTFSQL